MLALHLNRAHEKTFVTFGFEDSRRVVASGVFLLAGTAIVDYSTRAELSRGFVVVALPTAICLDLLGRRAVRAFFIKRRATRPLHRALVVGTAEGVAGMCRRISQSPRSTVSVVRTIVTPRHRGGVSGAAAGARGGAQDIVGEVLAALDETSATAVVLASAHEMDETVLRRLSWSLEGAPVELLIAPALTECSPFRLHVLPLGDLALLHVEQPAFRGSHRLIKAVCDRVLALVAIVILAPTLLAIAVAVRLTSEGPALFRQVRVGRDGQPFVVLKFRTMYQDAESRLSELLTANDSTGGVLFKIRKDPRITRVGMFLRRYSLDELPQLVNVLLGQMSLVGPRPPLMREVDKYPSEVYRRLLVKPGMTGLWQVRGRSDLPWDEAVRLDLYYVENWSLSLDLAIVWNTIFAVVRGTGAY
jgi:exopolysaccharide biosynthesis polyprenyl glycosylphosphotransferase